MPFTPFVGLDLHFSSPFLVVNVKLYVVVHAGVFVKQITIYLL